MTLQFKELEFSDLPFFRKMLSRHPQRICCFTPEALYAWKPVYDYWWAMVGPETFIVSFQPIDDDERHFFQPVGVFDDNDQAALLASLRALGYRTKIFNVSEAFIQKNVGFVAHFDMRNEDGLANYIYSAAEMAALRGRHNAKKRNKMTQANKLYQWSAEALTRENYHECLRVLEKWNSALSAPDESRYSEISAAQNALGRFPDLSYQGVMIRVAGQAAAFSMFSSLTPDMAALNFMKADRAYRGLSEIIHQETAKAVCAAGFTLINLEEDWDIPGLRENKASYMPIEKLPSCILELKE